MADPPPSPPSGQGCLRGEGGRAGPGLGAAALSRQWVGPPGLGGPDPLAPGCKEDSMLRSLSSSNNPMRWVQPPLPRALSAAGVLDTICTLQGYAPYPVSKQKQM